ncbi:MAG: hypothetical protein K6F91_01625 [Ruminococcus sp.]|nr:hypothetical protein [Ruminococcus sp.]
MVLDGFKGKYACINDPAKGFVKVSPEEFDKAFTGIVLNITSMRASNQAASARAPLTLQKNVLRVQVQQSLLLC